jgi:DNA-binding phage protein
MLEQIKLALKDRNLTVVAAATGLNPHTLYRLVKGTVKPSKVTLRVLSSYLSLHHEDVSSRE